MKPVVNFRNLIFLISAFLCQTQNAFAQSANENTMFSIEAARPIVLSGYTQVRFQSCEDKMDGFDIRRARLSLYGKLSKRMSYKLQNEFGGSNQKLLDAELSYQVSGLLTVHAGQFKIPFSLENLISSAGMATINRSQVVEELTSRSKDVLGNQGGRDVGMKLSGKYKFVDYSVGVFNGSGINMSDSNEEKDIVGRLVLHPMHSLAIGGSYYKGRMEKPGDAGAVDRNRKGAEIFWTLPGAILTAEYIQGTDDVIEKSGWYVQTEYEIIANKLSAVLKYDVFDADLDLIDNTTSVITPGITVSLPDKCKIQLNYELKSEDVEIDNNALLVQVQFGF